MKKKIAYIACLILLICLAKPMLGEDFTGFMKWWSILFVIGLVFLPLAKELFHTFRDHGYLFAKTIGLALGGYLLWLMSSVKFMKFTAGNGMICLFILAIPNGVLLYRNNRKKREQVRFAKESIKVSQEKENDPVAFYLLEEVLFLAIFLLWCYIKGFKAQAYGTEKFMDYGFMSILMRSEYMPPEDLWYAGGTINYYYFGQYLATYLTKMSQVTVNIGYNLMLMTIATFSVLLPFSVVMNLFFARMDKKQHTDCTIKNGKDAIAGKTSEFEKVVSSDKATKRLASRGKRIRVPKVDFCRSIPYVGGAFAALLVSCAGNMHFVIFKWVVPFLYKALGIDEEYSYWFPDSTRYIGYTPDTNDKTIHEFPSYSTILGDLHAHYINHIFAITVIALLLAWLIGQRKKKNLEENLKPLKAKQLLKEMISPNILIITFFIGMFRMTNYWDYPIYFVVSGAIILFSNAVTYRFSKNTWLVTAAQGILVYVGGAVVALPFTLNFDQISTEICVTQTHTPFYQLVVLWGLPVIIAVGYLISCVNEYVFEKRNLGNIQRKKESKKNIIKKGWAGFSKFHLNLNDIDMFVILLSLCAIGLVILPELIYVKDIYSGDYKRANTMFKLTYQAFIMFGMCSGYILVRLLVWGKNWHQRKMAILGTILSILTIGYVAHSTNAWFGDITKIENRGTLDAESFMYTTMPEDALAIEWLNENVTDQAIILEAPGDSYTDYGRVSVFTGLQTVSGWYVHEWLWRGDYLQLNDRNDEVETIYTSTDEDEVRSLIEKYEIEYIYVGKLEYEKYEEVNNDLLKSLGTVVYSNISDDEDAYETYIVKIQ